MINASAWTILPDENFIPFLFLYKIKNTNQ